jgi:carbon-monoxide dehydrogenase medium subunit
VADVLLHAPGSVEEASALLADYQGEARAIAGGTAVVLMLRQGLIRPQALVRLDRIAGLNSIARENGHARIGALTTLREAAADPLVREHLPALAGAFGLVGNVRVRNAATVGGNVCEADYASDPPGVLVAMDARVRVVSQAGVRETLVSELVTDFYETSLGPDELVTDVLVPIPPPGTRSLYLKYITRSSEDRPCVGTTALLRVGDDGRITDLRVGVGAVAGRILRLPESEATARGERPSEDLFAAIGQQYAEAAEPVADVRGSASYRKQMIAVFVRRALRAALAGETGARKV